MDGKAWKWHTSVQNQLNRWRSARRGRKQATGANQPFLTHGCLSRHLRSSDDNAGSMIDRGERRFPGLLTLTPRAKTQRMRTRSALEHLWRPPETT